MDLEVEVKFPCPDLGLIRENLQRIGADLKGRWFERNDVFDDAEQSLFKRDILLRLRDKGTGVLTVKQPPANIADDGTFKVREEYETEVADLKQLEKALRVLGYATCLAYEKVREKWDLDDTHVCIDKLPFGTWIEIEGPRESIMGLAERIGLDTSAGTDASYHDLHQAWRREQGLPFELSFVFPQDEAERLKRETSKQHN